MYMKYYKVYGIEGHRQRESFSPSYIHDFSNKEDGNRIIVVLNSDITHTNDYTKVIIIRDTEEDCRCEFWGQLSDGIFENCRVGKIEEIL